jgi:hypothetical protein
MSVNAVAVTVTYLAWDGTAGAPKTGDVANHTLRLVRDGAEATPSGTPAEVDATNAPGIYKLALTGAENTGTIMALVGKSATSGVVLVPTYWHNLDATIGSREVSGAAATAVSGLNNLSTVQAQDAAEAALAAYDAATGADVAAIDVSGVAAAVVAALDAAHGAGLWTSAAVATVTVQGYAGGAPEADIALVRGDTAPLLLEMVDADGVAVDLTDYVSGAGELVLTVKPQSARDDTDDAAAVCQIEGTSTAPTTGVAAFAFAEADTLACALGTVYDYDVQADDGAGTVQTLLRGALQVVWDVTRASSAV